MRSHMEIATKSTLYPQVCFLYYLFQFFTHLICIKQIQSTVAITYTLSNFSFNIYNLKFA
jgi:hypothetical protein